MRLSIACQESASTYWGTSQSLTHRCVIKYAPSNRQLRFPRHQLGCAKLNFDARTTNANFDKVLRLSLIIA